VAPCQWLPARADRFRLAQETLKSKLRSPAEGADTVTWLCCCDASKLRSGGFYFDRKEAEQHLTLAGTGYAPERVTELRAKLRTLAQLDS
jgi:hypothetical protein